MAVAQRDFSSRHSRYTPACASGRISSRGGGTAGSSSSSAAGRLRRFQPPARADTASSATCCRLSTLEREASLRGAAEMHREAGGGGPLQHESLEEEFGGAIFVD
jgi:hypothetical protein